LALYLWTHGQIEVGAVAMALPMSWQLLSMSGWVAWQVTNIFENIGVVQEGMMTIAQPIKLIDKPDASRLVVSHGEIVFDHVHFNYGRVGDPTNLQGKGGVLDGIDLRIRAGEKIGIVGRSGAGKSTLVNVLMRFFDLQSGRILIDGQDIASVTQESLRAQISM